jgi:uncharacterized protein
MTQSNGRFVWHDLMTTNKKASIAFYTELLGWKTKDVEMGPMGTYTMVQIGDRDVGGIMELDPKHGAPSHWLGYCTVDDVDQVTKKANELGGKTAVPPTDIPGVGRFSIIEDPQGGHLGPFKGTQAAPESDGPPPVGSFCWDELLADDPTALLPFYQTLFGWKTRSKDMGPMGTYHVLTRGEKDAAGLMKKQMAEAPTAWLHYVHVADVDASTKRAETLKAKVLLSPTDIPGIGRFSVIADPTGAPVALFKGASALANVCGGAGAGASRYGSG